MTLAFPDTSTFEFEFLRTLSHAPYGGADIGECFATAARITDGDAGSWHDEWKRTADRLAAQAEAGHMAGHTVSAREFWLRASNYFRSADFFLHAEVPDPRIDAARAASVSCYRKALPHFDIPAEEVRIPFAGTTLPGYFYAGTRRATVVIHNGFDGTGDECWFMGGKAAVDRGYNVLAFEGPGQGEVLHRQGLVFRPDWENVVSPVLDYLTTRSEVDPTHIALIGISMGGVLAPRAAAYDSRIAALIAFDGVFDMFEFALSLVPLPRPEASRRLLASHDPELDALLAEVIAGNPLARWSTDHGQWAFGTPTPRTFLAALHDYHLRDGIAERITCPTLVLKSEVDFAFTGQPEQLHDHLACPKEFVPFTSAEGAGAHCQVGAMTLACARIYDWLDNVFSRTAAP